MTELHKHLKMPSGLQREATTVHDTYILFIDLQVCEAFFFSFFLCNLIQPLTAYCGKGYKEVCCTLP